MLEVIDLYKTYEGKPLLNGVSFIVKTAETICLLGASGSGKSTILRLISGLEQPEGGEIRWDGHSLSGIPAHQRRFGLMFQDYALFPHLNVAQNIAFGLRMEHWPEKEIVGRVSEALSQVNLSGFEKRKVTDLSGGEQQRVAMGRTLAPRPRLLMLDEPLGALDRSLREKLIGELRTILKQAGIPAIYVTHDQEEAFTIADRILILHDGKIVQGGTASEVFSKPVSGWVARFLGLGNLVEGIYTARGFETLYGVLHPECGHRHDDRERILLLMRPQAVIAAKGSISGKVSDLGFHGQDYRLELDGKLFFYVPSAPEVGETVNLDVLHIQCLGKADGSD